jgi:hypothetical protein
MHVLRVLVACIVWALCPGSSRTAVAAVDPVAMVASSVAFAPPNHASTVAARRAVRASEKRPEPRPARSRPRAMPRSVSTRAFVLVTYRYLRNCALLY